MDCSKLMSGLSLLEMMLLAISRYTSVLKGESSAKLSQPSSKASRSSLSKRPTRLERAPRPRRSSASTTERPLLLLSSGTDMGSANLFEGAYPNVRYKTRTLWEDLWSQRRGRTIVRHNGGGRWDPS